MLRSWPTAEAIAALAIFGLTTVLAGEKGHPIVTQGDRRYVLGWLVAIFGLPVLVERLIRRVRDLGDVDHESSPGEPAPASVA